MSQEISFNEITKNSGKSILKRHRGEIGMDLVDAQQARRMLTLMVLEIYPDQPVVMGKSKK